MLGILRRLIPAWSFIRLLQYPAIVRLMDMNDQMVVLDLGCGNGSFVRLMPNCRNVKVVALDYSMAMLQLAKLNLKGENAHLVSGDGNKLPLTSEVLDLVLLSSVLQMVKTPERLLDECRRVLRNGATLVLSVPSEYIFIPKLYRKTKSRFRYLFLSFLKMPLHYDQFLTSLNDMFGVEGYGNFKLDELRKFLGGHGFKIADYYYSPGPVGSLLWEMGVVLSRRFSGSGIPLALLFLLYPLTLLDRIIPAFRDARGCELVIKCIKV